MATIKLTPSTYYRNNSSYVSVTDADNMYTNIDSETTAAIRNSRNNTSNTYYCYLRGFNFSDVPSNAIVSSFEIKIRAYESYMSTSSSYRMSLYNGTTSISNTTVASSLGTSAKTLTFPIPSALTWEVLKGYGSNFGIRIPLRRSSTSYNSYIYVYGAEIDVTYTVPVYHSVTVSNSTSATVTVSNSNPLEGNDVEVRASSIDGIKIADNGTDVTSQFTQRSETAESWSVANVGDYGFSLNSSTGYYVSQNKGISKTAALCRVDFHVPVAATITFTYINYAEQGYDFGVFGNIDVALSDDYYAAGSSGATITDSSYKRACNTSSYNSSSAQTITYDMSAGDHSIWVKYSKDDASNSGNDTLQFKVSITLDEPFTPGTYWVYDITNVIADHAIVVTKAGPFLYVKQGNVWVKIAKAYKKINGSWQQIELNTAFNQNGKYVRG